LFYDNYFALNGKGIVMRTWNLAIRLLCLVGAALLLAAPWSMAFDAHPMALATQGQSSNLNLGIETLAQRQRAVLVSLLPALAGLYALARLWQLFGRYARGEVFSAATVRVFAHFAYGLLAFWCVSVLGRGLMSVALTWDRPPGHRVLMLGLGSDDFVLLLFGVVLVAIAQVMRRAAQLAQDNAGFV
jgi:Protein of unknown function (DUF2975)